MVKKEKDIIVGCTVNIPKNGSLLTGEVLAVRTINSKLQYYIHLAGYNKRLDEWIDHEKVEMTGIVYPAPATAVDRTPSSSKSTSKAQQSKSVSKKTSKGASSKAASKGGNRKRKRVLFS